MLGQCARRQAHARPSSSAIICISVPPRRSDSDRRQAFPFLTSQQEGADFFDSSIDAVEMAAVAVNVSCSTGGPPPPPAIPREEWALHSTPEAWESYARAAAASRVYGECVLDASAKTILNYLQAGPCCTSPLFSST